MEIKSAIIQPGTILCWKEYNIFTRLWNKLRGKELPNNKFIVVPYKVELISLNKYYFKSNGTGSYSIAAYVPIRKYSKRELDELTTIYRDDTSDRSWSSIRDIINIIRPNTFTGSTIENSKYYRKRDLNAEANEYIY